MKIVDIINGAGRLSGVLASGEVFSGNDYNDYLSAADGVLEGWINQGFMLQAENREVYNLTGGQTYTMGVGQNFDILPANIIPKVGLRVGSTSQSPEYPLQIINQDEYANITQKRIVGQPQYVYFAWGSDRNINFKFYPEAPTGSSYYACIYTKRLDQWPLSNFNPTVDLSWKYGYVQALLYELALVICAENGREPPKYVYERSKELKADIMRSNLKSAKSICDYQDGYDGAWQDPNAIYSGGNT